MIPFFSAPRWPSLWSPWVMTPMLALLLWVAGMEGGGATAGLIGYLEQTNDHRFEPWIGDDPSFSEDPFSVLGPPLSPLALFPWMWQRHHPGDVVSRHTVELLEAQVIRPVPPLKRAPLGERSTRGTGPWGTRRNLEETYRELIGDPPRETVAGKADQDGAEGTGGQTSPGAERRSRKDLDDDSEDD